MIAFNLENKQEFRELTPDCLPVLPGLGRSAAGLGSADGALKRVRGGALASKNTSFTSSRVSSLKVLENFVKDKYVLASRHRARKAGSGLTVRP